MTSPVEIIGTDRVEAIKIVKNELYQTEKGEIRPRETDQFETIPVGLVFRSVGYLGTPLPGVPFYEKWGTIPNEKGRVMTTIKDGQQVIGNYVVGWIKRGPSGVIGTNKPDSVETVEMLLEDFANNKLLAPESPNRAAIENLLNERGIEYVTFEDWLKLDEIEQERGAAVNRPRVKFSSVDEMLEAIEKVEESLPDPAGD